MPSLLLISNLANMRSEFVECDQLAGARTLERQFELVQERVVRAIGRARRARAAGREHGGTAHLWSTRERLLRLANVRFPFERGADGDADEESRGSGRRDPPRGCARRGCGNRAAHELSREAEDARRTRDVLDAARDLLL